jgi:hypothetical protein
MAKLIDRASKALSNLALPGKCQLITGLAFSGF